MRRDLPLILLEKKDWPSDATKAIYHEIIISQNKRSIKITKKKKKEIGIKMYHSLPEPKNFDILDVKINRDLIGTGDMMR